LEGRVRVKGCRRPRAIDQLFLASHFLFLLALMHHGNRRIPSGWAALLQQRGHYIGVGYWSLACIFPFHLTMGWLVCFFLHGIAGIENISGSTGLDTAESCARNGLMARYLQIPRLANTLHIAYFLFPSPSRVKSNHRFIRNQKTVTVGCA